MADQTPYEGCSWKNVELKDFYEWKGEVNTRLSNIEKGQEEQKLIMAQVLEAVNSLKVEQSIQKTKLATIVATISLVVSQLANWLGPKMAAMFK